MSVREIKCPNCGGYMQFSPKDGKIKCDFCDSVFEAETLEQYAQITEEQHKDRFKWDFSENNSDEATVYTCPACGGEIITDDDKAASRCPYCDSPVVMTSRVSGVYRPEFIIPFSVTKEQAMQAYKDFCRKQPLLPKMFKQQARVEKITGIYAPFWIFDCDCNASAQYKTTKTRMWSDSNYNYTETSHFLVYRRGDLRFRAIPVDGSSKLENEYSESIEPYDISKAVPFNSAYLMGFIADKYDQSADFAAKRANERIKNSADYALRNTVIGYSSIVSENFGVDLYNAKSHYAMLPVWLLTTRYKDRVYSFAMNGQTGKFVGTLPPSIPKALGIFAAVTTGLTAVLSIIGSLIF